MLRYIAAGVRPFGTRPYPLVKRANWEFYAIVRGKCGPTFPNREAVDLRAHGLWVFPPQVLHGWAGETGRTCYVIAFHFGFVPPQLEEMVRARGQLFVPLAAAEVQRLLALEKELHAEFDRPTSLSQLKYHRGLIELTLLALRDNPPQFLEKPGEHAARKVEAAMIWYAEHLPERPRLSDVACAVHVAPSHLRRLFWRARRENPQRAFARLKLDRAMELMSSTELKLEAIAERCGFAGASDLSRAFKAHRKQTPQAWRKALEPPFRRAALVPAARVHQRG
jgi:AraC family transcriptional regulator